MERLDCSFHAWFKEVLSCEGELYSYPKCLAVMRMYMIDETVLQWQPVHSFSSLHVKIRGWHMFLFRYSETQ
jgi:hypothetical protein